MLTLEVGQSGEPDVHPETVRCDDANVAGQHRVSEEAILLFHRDCLFDRLGMHQQAQTGVRQNPAVRGAVEHPVLHGLFETDDVTTHGDVVGLQVIRRLRPPATPHDFGEEPEIIRQA